MLKSELIGLLEALPDCEVVVEMTHFDEHLSEDYTAWHEITAVGIGAASFWVGKDMAAKQAVLITTGEADHAHPVPSIRHLQD